MHGQQNIKEIGKHVSARLQRFSLKYCL